MLIKRPHYLPNNKLFGSFKQTTIGSFLLSFLADKNELGNDCKTAAEQFKNSIRVIYPTKDYVESSCLSRSGSKGLFLRESLFTSFKFEKNIFQKYKRNRFFAAIIPLCLITKP